MCHSFLFGAVSAHHLCTAALVTHAEGRVHDATINCPRHTKLLQHDGALLRRVPCPSCGKFRSHEKWSKPPDYLTLTVGSLLLQESLPDNQRLIAFHAASRCVHEQINAIYEGASIQAYGSLSSNLQLPNSDVDLCIVFDQVQVCFPVSRLGTSTRHQLSQILQRRHLGHLLPFSVYQ
jgi:predicted nucleotidyltransferase